MRIDPETISNHGLSKQEIDSLVQEYLARFEEEAQTIRAEQRPNRPVPKRLDEINHLISSEVAEYQSGPGLEIPDMATLNSVKALLAWDGTRESLNLLKLVRCKYEMS